MALLLLAGCQTTSQSKSAHNLFSPTGPVVTAIEKDIAANRLTRPTGNNALEKINRLSLIAPGDSRIDAYRVRVSNRLVQLGQKAFLDKKYYRAKLLALRALKISREHAEAGYILDAIREAEKPLQTQILATETVIIEEVDAPTSVGIITVTIPDLQGTVIESSASENSP